ncbi:MAG: hypothetical protein JST75_20090 [Bacteroidetes bacterium]|nr:hypothetical protein [Bacteroidota bacterium]
MKEDLPPLELWIQDIQSYLYKIVNVPLGKAGFKFDKYNYSFERKYKKNTQDFGFLFVNQFPVNYRVNFMLQIRNKKVKEAKTAFFHSLNRDDFKLNSLAILLRDFGEPVSEPGKKDFIIFGNKELFDAAESISKILQYEAIPLCDQLSDLNDLDTFYDTRNGWSVTNYNIDNIISELIIARLNRKRNFQKVYEQIADKLQKKDSIRKIDTDASLIAERCYQFILKKY